MSHLKKPKFTTYQYEFGECETEYQRQVIKIQKQNLLHNMNLENPRQNTNANVNARLRTWTPIIQSKTITQHQHLVRGNSSNVSQQLINTCERISNIDPKNHFLQNLS